MPNWNESNIKTQFKSAVRDGWLAHFEEAAVKNGFPIEDLLGIASRETNMRNIVGDGGRGFGVMQVDIGTNKSFCESGKWQDPRMAIGMGTAILASKRQQLINSSAKPVHVKARSGYEETFECPTLQGEDLRRVTIAAYNVGLWSARNFAKHNDPDRSTTGRDYSKDVLARSAVFKALLDAHYEEKIQKEMPNRSNWFPDKDKG